MRCFNTTHIVMPDNMHVACGIGFSCAPLPIPSCISEQGVAGHTPKAAGYEIIASMPALQLGLCTENATDDASKGKNLCEAWHATKMMKPTFGIHFSSTWGRVSNVSDAPCDPDLEPAGSNNICRGCKTGLEYRQCWSKNLKNLSSAMISQSPKLMLQCDLAEIIYCDDHACNLDNPSDFAEGRACIKGSMGKWGPGTCVPDVRTAQGQAYFVDWGKAYLDGGCRALYWGEARMIGGQAPNSSCVSALGSAGFAAVIVALRDYASASGYGPTFYGPQAACGFPLANGTDVADFVIGAQHLQGNGDQVLCARGFGGTRTVEAEHCS